MRFFHILLEYNVECKALSHIQAKATILHRHGNAQSLTCPHHSSPLHHCPGPVWYFLHCTFSQYYSTGSQSTFSLAIPCKPCLPCFNLSCSLLMAQIYCFQQLWVSFNSCYFCFLMCSESAFPAIYTTGRNLDLK